MEIVEDGGEMLVCLGCWKEGFWILRRSWDDMVDVPDIEICLGPFRW